MKFSCFELQWKLLNTPFNSYKKILIKWIQTYASFSTQIQVDNQFFNIDLKKEWSLSNETQEEMTQIEHAIKVSKQFHLYHTTVLINKIVPLEQFQCFLLLHDIGKNLSKRVTNNKKNQHRFTFKIMKAVWEKHHCQHWITLSESLLFYDPLGSLLKGEINTEECTHIIHKGAKKTSFIPSDFFKILLLYYLCDASSYETLMKNIFTLLPNQTINITPSHNRYKEYLKVCHYFNYR